MGMTMAQRLRPLNPELSPRHRFGCELRRKRLAQRLSLAALGGKINYSGDLLGRVEKAERRPSVHLVEALDRALGAGGELIQQWRAIATPTREDRPLLCSGCRRPTS
ncbi:helix-turn-helix domain-containing protein [Catenulispora sp. GAS73]|uniref:helix-turn-helix domain-containing protein n=1 Tax=Catenulispora sp. GAS73 TaxID=3156269 RepID=UPI0035193A2C